MDSNVGSTGNIFYQAWELTRKSLLPSLIVMGVFTGLRLLLAWFVFPENPGVITSPEEINPAYIGKLMAGFALVSLLSFLILLFIVSLTASKNEGRPWTWNLGFHMSLNKLFGFTLAVIFLFFQVLAIMLLLSLVLGLLSGGKEEWLPVILGFQFILLSVLTFVFLVNFALLPQVLLLEDLPALLSLRRAAYLTRHQRLRILGFFAACYGPLLVPQLYIIAASLGPNLGFSLQLNDNLSLGITIFTQVVTVILLPLTLAGTTVFYYRAKSREVRIEV